MDTPLHHWIAYHQLCSTRSSVTGRDWETLWGAHLNTMLSYPLWPHYPWIRACNTLVFFVRMCTPRVRIRMSSYRLYVCLSICSLQMLYLMNCFTYDLDIRHVCGPWPWILSSLILYIKVVDQRSRSRSNMDQLCFDFIFWCLSTYFKVKGQSRGQGQRSGWPPYWSRSLLFYCHWHTGLHQKRAYTSLGTSCR